MLIQVVYADNHHDYVKPIMLDALIETSKISKFKRSSGWVTIGTDRVRSTRRESSFMSADDVKKLSAVL